MREEVNGERMLSSGIAMRLARFFLRSVGYVLVTALAAFVGGFLLFYQHVASMKPPADPKADAIVVLTGGYQRVDQGVQLLAKGAATRLLISGVNPATTGNHIRVLTRSSTNLFECCVDIGHEAVDTTGNASETTRWIKAHNFKSVILVTNNYHMPRSLAEIRRADDHSTFIPYPVESDLSLSDIAANPLLLRTLASEYVKFLLVESRDWTGISR
ncbi:YdcF family protein [Rhizobium sp. KVB221]|uniref:YdcF family protein n=2 Tax=Rhizobium setariae TaxID=2801340 RepID=A0A936YW32_9HYPH|nr:YdcF family protein [Rhizobium setariae]